MIEENKVYLNVYRQSKITRINSKRQRKINKNIYIFCLQKTKNSKSIKTYYKADNRLEVE